MPYKDLTFLTFVSNTKPLLEPNKMQVQPTSWLVHNLTDEQLNSQSNSDSSYTRNKKFCLIVFFFFLNFI